MVKIFYSNYILYNKDDNNNTNNNEGKAYEQKIIKGFALLREGQELLDQSRAKSSLGIELIYEGLREMDFHRQDIEAEKIELEKRVKYLERQLSLKSGSEITSDEELFDKSDSSVSENIDNSIDSGIVDKTKKKSKKKPKKEEEGEQKKKGFFGRLFSKKKPEKYALSGPHVDEYLAEHKKKLDKQKLDKNKPVEDLDFDKNDDEYYKYDPFIGGSVFDEEKIKADLKKKESREPRILLERRDRNRIILLFFFLGFFIAIFQSILQGWFVIIWPPYNDIELDEMALWRRAIRWVFESFVREYIFDFENTPYHLDERYGNFDLKIKRIYRYPRRWYGIIEKPNGEFIYYVNKKGPTDSYREFWKHVKELRKTVNGYNKK